MAMNSNCIKQDGEYDCKEERRMKNDIEYVAYHRVKRVFIPITDIESENPEDIEVYEFEGQNFKLIAN